MKFEKAQANVFKHPNEDILKIEAKKIQFLTSFREAYKKVDRNIPNKNILSAPSAYLFTMSAIQDFRNEIRKQKRTCLQNTDKMNYLNGLQEIGDLWFNCMEEWTPDIYNYPHKEIKKDTYYSQYDYNFNNPNVNLENFASLTNILSGIDNNYLPNYTRGYQLNTVGLAKAMKEADKSFFCLNEDNKNNANLTNIHNALKKAYSNNFAMDVMNLAFLAAARTKKMSDIKAAYLKIASETYDIIYNKITQDSSQSTLTGYKNIGNFEW